MAVRDSVSLSCWGRSRERARHALHRRSRKVESDASGHSVGRPGPLLRLGPRDGLRNGLFRATTLHFPSMMQASAPIIRAGGHAGTLPTTFPPARRGLGLSSPSDDGGSEGGEHGKDVGRCAIEIERGADRADNPTGLRRAGALRVCQWRIVTSQNRRRHRPIGYKHPRTRRRFVLHSIPSLASWGDRVLAVADEDLRAGASTARVAGHLAQHVRIMCCDRPPAKKSN